MMRRAPIPHNSVRQCARLRPSELVAAAGATALVLSWRIAACARSRSPSLAQDPSLQRAAEHAQKLLPQDSPAASSGQAPKIDRAQPLYMQADQLLYDTKNNRVIAQGNVEIYYNNYILTADQVIYDQNAQQADRGGQRPAEGPERQHHPGRPLRGARRFPRRLHPVAQRGHARRHAHRRRARHPARRQHHRIRARQVHALQERPGHAAAVVHQRRAHHSRSAGRHHHLPGRAVRAVRRARALPALLPAPRPVGEARSPAS